MNISDLLQKPLWQMTGEEFMFLSKTASRNDDAKKDTPSQDASEKKYVYGIDGIADILYQASEVFRCAIDAIIHFSTEICKSIFGNDEAADIKSVMRQYGETTEQKKAVGAWLCDYAKHLQSFDETQQRQTLNKVGDVAEGRYDWKIERGNIGGVTR